MTDATCRTCCQPRAPPAIAAQSPTEEIGALQTLTILSQPIRFRPRDASRA